MEGGDAFVKRCELDVSVVITVGDAGLGGRQTGGGDAQVSLRALRSKSRLRRRQLRKSATGVRPLQVQCPTRLLRRIDWWLRLLL